MTYEIKKGQSNEQTTDRNIAKPKLFLTMFCSEAKSVDHNCGSIYQGQLMINCKELQI
jgi:hypothetical protein